MFDPGHKLETGWQDPPRVEAAAIVDASGKVWSLPPPARHHDVGRMMIESGYPAPFPCGDAQGFLMSDGTFASRLMALYAAAFHGQILAGCGHHRELFSEDVW